ncbi:EF-hand domain-containing protein [Amaricoccus sp.]|uniref:EF-hand domain-containing protein n=1 Tax=Amaricoccus sp. TaxID=1872485 RepID=UPI001B54543B|nr:EF-hand domain-containing protein [Amaricoccus sp.]MBP7003475.1 EF-hand domain-containing protein [Amaricoccus sp.]
MRRTLTLAAATLALSAGLAAAQDAAAPAAGVTDAQLAAVDTDKDGAVSQNEFVGALTKIFKALDADANGAVTWAEAEGKLAREHFDAFDANKDGKVTPPEVDAQAKSDFAAGDQDKDGALN